MTVEELQGILASDPKEIINKLKKSSFTIPKWSDLEKEYNPLKHAIFDEALYPKKLNETSQDDFKRTPLALQKLAVQRIAQAMFATPVTRTYTYDTTKEKQQLAVSILEKLYATENFIDAENIERAKKLNATCQIATVWYSYPKNNVIEGTPATLKLSHKTYSEMDGYEIYAQTDNVGNILVVSIFYKDSAGVEHLYVYTNEENKPSLYVYDKGDDWVQNMEASKSPLEVFPVIYAPIAEPVWGGAYGTKLVEQLEEMESYQGMYIKRNALPTFVLDYGDMTGGQKVETEEKGSDARRIIQVGKGGTMQDVTWEGAEKAVSARYARIRNAFFEQVQMPDISFANLINSNTSAENKELLFSDAKAKAADLGGEWARLFYLEMEVVKAFAKVIFPSIAAELDLITCTSTINPYSIKSKKETAEYVSLAGSAMSLETKVKTLDEVADVAKEVELIQAELGTQANLGI